MYHYVWRCSKGIEQFWYGNTTGFQDCVVSGLACRDRGSKGEMSCHLAEVPENCVLVNDLHITILPILVLMTNPVAWLA